MRRTRQRRGLVVLVVLLLGLSLVAPAAAGPHDEETASGDSFGDSLPGADGSTDDLSTDESGSSDTDSSSDSDPDSGVSSSSDDGSSDPDSGLGSSSGDGSSDSDEERVLDDDSLSGETGMSPSGPLSKSLSTVMSDSVSGSGDESASDTTALVALDTTTTSGTTNYEVELVELDGTDTAALELTATATTTEVLTTVGTFGNGVVTTSDRLTTGTSDGMAAPTDAARVESFARDPASSDDGGAADAREPEADGDGAGDAAPPPRNTLGVPAPGDDLPDGPAGTGAVVGLAGVAAIAVRQSGALSGMIGSLDATARTAAASVPESGRLDRLVRMLAPFRYSRYDDSDPLEHEAREALFEVVEQSPGTYLSEIADHADLPLSTARHHIRVLEREDLVTGAKVRGKRRFYPAHTEGVELAAAMNDDSTAAVIDALARLGAASVSDLAAELGKDPSTVTHHVQRLEEDGVVVRERDGRAVMNTLSAAARTMLEPDGTPAESPTAGEAMASD